ncbi:hypothetical protein PIB30_018973 [Stylosanthes scabra]|uniref:Uncharacterized protein n=1 Tax=Stylosanthes scabra TaxID=79078 RepID=A0ABU6Z7P3_9FABA|nr:hypothetical protein [Stylosanthes scabra]
MENLSMLQRPKTVALEDENPGTYGTTLIYPLNRLVSVASWVTRLLILGLASSVDARVSPKRMRTLGLMEGVDLPTRPIGRVWLRRLHAKHLYLGISGVYGDTSDISIHGLAPFYQILFISLVNHHSLTLTIATPVFLTTKIVPCVNSLGDNPSLVLGIFKLVASFV